MQRPVEGQVAIGVDTHKEIHVAAAADWQGTLIDERCFATTRQGYRRLESWARSLGEVLRVGVECSGSYGSGLTRHLLKNGFTVLEVTFPDKTVRRKRGKDDFIDAEMAAEAAFTGARTVTPKNRDGMVEALRTLQKTRSTAVAARRVALQTIRADIISAPEELRDQLRGMTRMQLIRHLVATRPDSTDFRTPLGAAKIALKRLAKRYVDLDDEVSELDDVIDAIPADAAPLLVQLKCVGAQSAAQLMVTVGDNPERLGSEASFAMLCGVAPVPVSSGMTYRHRLNRGGDRQANSAIHIIAIGRLRTDERYQGTRRQEDVRGAHQDGGYNVPEALYRAGGLLRHKKAKRARELLLTFRRASTARNTCRCFCPRPCERTASGRRWAQPPRRGTTPPWSRSWAS